MTSAGALRLVERRGGWTLDRRPRERGRYVTRRHSNKLLGRPQTASVGQMSLQGNGIDRTSSCGTVSRRAGGDANAPTLAGRPRSPAGACRAPAGGRRRRFDDLAEEEGFRPLGGERGPRRTLPRNRPRALLPRRAPCPRARAARRARYPHRRGEGRAGGGAAAPRRGATLPRRRAPRTRAAPPAPLRAGRLRSARGRARRRVGRRSPGQPGLPRPSRRPGPDRDRADAHGEPSRAQPQPRPRRQATNPRAPDRRSLAVDARARSGARTAGLLPREARRAAPLERRRDRRLPAAGARGAGEGAAGDSRRRGATGVTDHAGRGRRPHAHRLCDRVLDPRHHSDGRAHRLGRRCGRPERDPARHPADDPGLRVRSRRGHGLRDPGSDDRHLVPDGGPGTRLGPADRHDHAALTRLCGARRGDFLSETVEFQDERTADTVRVLLVDDHDLFRTGLRNLLEERGVQVAGEAGQGADAVRLVRELAPEVVVMDLHMPGMNGIEAIRQIHSFAPLTRVLVLTISDQDDDVLDAILAGACGYLLKDASVDELIRGIVAAAVGESLVSPAIAGKVLQQVRATAVSPEAADSIRAELSERELDVLKLIAAGNDNAMIAAQLHISPKTVKNHISNILMKLQIENRIQAAVYAVRSGLV